MVLPTFSDQRFPEDISLGSGGGPSWRIDSVQDGAGNETNVLVWSDPLRTYNIAEVIKFDYQIAELYDFWYQHRGPLIGFRLKDWSDYFTWDFAAQQSPMPVAPGILGVGDGANKDFQLVKRYGTGATEYIRTIKTPRITGATVAPFKVFFDSVEQVSGWTIDEATGLLSFSSAPSVDVIVQAEFEFDVPVHFTQNNISTIFRAFVLQDVPNLQMDEIRI